jgi:retron-type reverse transcriptase
MRPRAEAVNGARVQGKSASLPGETCRQAGNGNPDCEVRLRRQGSAEAILPPPIRWEGLNIEGKQSLLRSSTLSSSRDERGRQNSLDRETAGQRREVKLPLADQRAEPSPARDERKTSAELWEQVWERQNLLAALERVERNGGAPGIDGMRVTELRPYLRENWLEIKEALDQQRYQPRPVRRVEIPKPDGGVRLLGIPTVIDRFLQQAMAQALMPLFEPLFSNHSYGYRPRRSAHQAVQQAQEYVQEGYEWVVDIDLEKFFDRVNHDMLMARMARVVKDKRVLKLIRAYLNSGVMVNGVVMDTEEGTPQGGLCEALHNPPYAKKVIMQSN